MTSSVKSPERLRIALVTPMLPLKHDRTRGRYIHETARSLAKMASVRVFFQELATPRIPGLRSRSYLDAPGASELMVDDIDVESLRYPAFPGVSRALNGYTSSFRLEPLVRRFAPDVVLGYWLYPDGFAAVRVARALGVPAVVGALGSDVHRPTSLNRWFGRQVVRKADSLLTVSEDMRSCLIRDFDAQPARVHAVVNGINPDAFRPRDRASCRAELGVPHDARLILYVGRFVRPKGLLELVDAFSRLVAELPSARLALVGDGVMREELLALLQTRGLAERCFTPGGLEPEAVATWLGAADLLCLPSWSEGYPNVVVEAAACGRPIVATDVGGTREIVNADNGVLIPPKNVDRLLEALRAVLTSHWDAERISRSVRRSWDDVAAETLEVCRQSLRQRASAGKRNSRA